ncbi:MAG: hypothetical protein D6731_09825 [Planctomycetota bacterium]|nr:MAG: hypothetical protein D6731_09825 [Planctomycetota bacterium]
MESDTPDAAPGSAPAPDPSLAPRRAAACCLTLAALLFAALAGGRFLAARLRARLLPTPEARTLAEALAELGDLARLGPDQRAERLRVVLRRLVDSRRAEAGPRERALLHRALRELGEGASPEALARTLDELRALRAGQAPPTEAQALERLVGLARSLPLPAGGAPRPLGADDDPPDGSLRPAAPSGDESTPEAPAKAWAAQVGQWVLFEERGADSSNALRYTYRELVAIDGETLTVRCQELDARRRPQGAPYIVYAEETPPAPPPGARAEELEVAGSVRDCYRIERRDAQGRAVRVWTSFQVPVAFGLYAAVREEVLDTSGAVVLRRRLVDYGVRDRPAAGSTSAAPR